MDLFPEVYKTKRPLHDDWVWPLCYIPRRWTGIPLYMPSTKVCGNAEPRLIEVQPGYPLAPDAFVTVMPDGKTYVMGMDPVPPLGQWSIQAV